MAAPSAPGSGQGAGATEPDPDLGSDNDPGDPGGDSGYWDSAETAPRRRCGWPLPQRLLRPAREALLVAAVGTGSFVLVLLLEALLPLGHHAALALTLLLSLSAYALVRRRLQQPQAAQVRGAQRLLELLHRHARQLEAEPERLAELAQQLLCEMFEPAQVQQLLHRLHGARVLGRGAALAVPLPSLQPHTPPPCLALLLHLAQRGRRAFTPQDARLAQCAIEQLCHAAAHRLAVEHGRHEERLRLAQDLHDDIGARLLALTVRARDAETEAYARRTLQDLKTLTRGLAAGSHRLLHAEPEWKADIRKRLEDAGCALDWRFELEGDAVLSMAEWLALTRVLRELVSNAIAHARPARVEVHGRYAGGTLELAVRDDGHGGPPQQWAHGLGLGSVRKRVRLLGGQVQWQQREPHGIECRVLVPRLGQQG